MKLSLSLLLSAIALFLCADLAAQDSNSETFGPYTAIVRDKEIVKDVRIADNGRIYLLLNPDYKEKEIILKNSNYKGRGYRNWFNGKQELISPANQGKAPNEYTDWVETTANFVEYYMGEKLILHIGKTAVLSTN